MRDDTFTPNVEAAAQWELDHAPDPLPDHDGADVDFPMAVETCAGCDDDYCFACVFNRLLERRWA